MTARARNVRQLRPQDGLLELENAGRLRSIPTVGHASLRDPALYGLRIDADLRGKIVQRQVRIEDGLSEWLVDHDHLPCSSARVALSRTFVNFPPDGSGTRSRCMPPSAWSGLLLRAR